MRPCFASLILVAVSLHASAVSTTNSNGSVMTPNSELTRNQLVATDVSGLLSSESDPNVVFTNGELLVHGERVKIGPDETEVQEIANAAVETNALTVATTNRVALLESSKADNTALTAHVANTDNPHAVTAAQVGAVPKVLKAVDSDLTVRELNDEGDIIIKGQDGSDVLKVTVGKEDNNYTSSIYVDDFVDLTIGGVRSWGEYGLSSSAKKKLDVKTFTSTSNEFARKLGELETADERNFNTLDDKVKDIKYIARAFDVWKTNNYVAVGKDADGYAIKDGQVTRDSQVAIGEGAKALEDRAVAIGKQSKASGVDSVAVGTKASSNGRGTIVIGNNAIATVGQDRAVVIGSIGDDDRLKSNGSDTFTVSAEDLTKFYFRDKTLKSLIEDNLPTNAASKAEMEKTKSALAAHAANTDNPHAVTAAQVGAVGIGEDIHYFSEGIYDELSILGSTREIFIQSSIYGSMLDCHGITIHEDVAGNRRYTALGKYDIALIDENNPELNSSLYFPEGQQGTIALQSWQSLSVMLDSTDATVLAENQTFSNAVLSVQVSTNDFAALYALKEAFADLPIDPVTGGISIGALLAALASAVVWLKRNKVQTLKLNDNSVETSADGGVAKLDDFFTESTGFTLPTEVAGALKNSTLEKSIVLAVTENFGDADNTSYGSTT